MRQPYDKNLRAVNHGVHPLLYDAILWFYRAWFVHLIMILIINASGGLTCTCTRLFFLFRFMEFISACFSVDRSHLLPADHHYSDNIILRKEILGCDWEIVKLAFGKNLAQVHCVRSHRDNTEEEGASAGCTYFQCCVWTA